MDTDLARQVSENEWYQTIELPGGVVTPGFFDHRPLLSHYGFPESLDGARVLDVGTFDGFFAFEMERRGATEVVAVDIPDLEALDWPEPLRRQGHTRFQPRHKNFDLAKRALGSRVIREFVTVYDISQERLGTFDYIFVGSLLCHLRDPVRALAVLREVCRGTLHLAEATHRGMDLLFPRRPVARFQAISPHLTWWIPNRRCLDDWALAAGYTQLRRGKTFVLPYTRLRGGVRHSVLFARPLPASPTIDVSAPTPASEV